MAQVLRLDLGEYVVEGEKEVTERFDGGLSNPLCDVDASDATDDMRPATDEESAMTGCDLGDAIALDDLGNALDGTDPDADIDSYRFNLEGVARDRRGFGDIGPNDIISVVVNGRTALASTDNDNAPGTSARLPGTQLSKGRGCQRRRRNHRGCPARCCAPER